jgi:hypothetical protein
MSVDPKASFAFFATVLVAACRALACGAEVPGVLLLVAAVLCLGLAQPSDASSRDRGELFVSVTGSDANPGTQREPLRTLEAARDHIRALKDQERFPVGGVTVWLRGGRYYLDKGVVLTEQDSGTAAAPISYRAYHDEEVRLIGGREVTGFRPTRDPAIIARLDPQARGNVLEADIGPLTEGVTSGLDFDLFFEDQCMQLARWPNESYVNIAEVLYEKPWTHGKTGDKVGKFFYEGDRPQRWGDEPEIWLYGFWFFDWSSQYQKVESIDTGERMLHLAKPWHGYGYVAGQRYYAVNLLVELDQPGEWYFDSNSGKLYFWPPEPIEAGTALISLLEEPLVELQNCSHIRLEGLIFECCRGHAIVTNRGSSDNLVTGCTLRNVGGDAIILSDAWRTGVVSCELYDLDAGGIVLDGGDRKTLAAGGNHAENNHIWNFGRTQRTYHPAVKVLGVGNRVAHNLIHHTPHMGILASGNDHVVEFNEIHHVALETGDVGALYIGPRDFSRRGTIIRYNYFHHIEQMPGLSGGTMGVYLDDLTSGVTVFGNVFYRTTFAAFIGGGRDNTIENNIFVECDPAVHVDNRGMNTEADYFESLSWKWLEEINYTEPPYSERYPQLLTIVDDEPRIPKGNRVIRNICVGGRWLNIFEGYTDENVLFADNLIDKDPRFVAPEQEDFRLSGDSPAWALGFQLIPIQEIGLVRDEYRTDTDLPEATEPL